MSLHWMCPEDFDEVLAIDSDGGGVADREQLYDLLQMKHIRCMIWKVDNVVGGFALYEIAKKSVELFYIMVDVKRRRTGIGTALVKCMVDRASHAGMEVKTIVRETALGAQLFFKSLGFVAYKVNRKFYPDTEEDAYFFKLSKKASV